MAPLRDIDPDGLYHVMSRGNFRQEVFLDDAHYLKYLELTQRVARRRHWTILDWCLIPNHFHLLIQLSADGLSDGMRELNGCYSRWSNLRTGRTGTGHLWKNRPTLVNVFREGHFWEVMTYIPLNPVKAGLSSLPGGWRWTGYRGTIGLEHPYPFHQPAELLRYFDARLDVARDKYRALVRSELVRAGHVTWSDHGLNGAPLAGGMVESTA
jgi:REP element-mobilizing transposase RayT